MFQLFQTINLPMRVYIRFYFFSFPAICFISLFGIFQSEAENRWPLAICHLEKIAPGDPFSQTFFSDCPLVLVALVLVSLRYNSRLSGPQNKKYKIQNKPIAGRSAASQSLFSALPLQKHRFSWSIEPTVPQPAERRSVFVCVLIDCEGEVMGEWGEGGLGHMEITMCSMQPKNITNIYHSGRSLSEKLVLIVTLINGRCSKYFS